MNPVPASVIEKIVADSFGQYEMRGTRSMSNTNSNTFQPSCITTALTKEEFKKIQKSNKILEDRDTMTTKGSTHDLMNEFSQIFKNSKQ